ncbi:TPA: hypothetical protein ACRFDF_002178 [Yersinia enterocolitica]|uniref:hypothetical protein n=1 Tax=Yersinia enterocolitica TaxID=630 RepID=UPI0021E95242|nr:hypothetical protein [Yersinia enterocolitica]EKN3946271.1 hypothetical protein [Yersinia enterocolitica]EKN5071904.1 hypothetical protein [Yersinia enterocolitica]EKN6315919.1 hypothetical protein [Yersinia enterocolitica]ELI8168353.1 hypothetical protein [Yersinia enterocolitica]UYJ95872.1 hypothetical protein N4W06_13200 [Yersinia enterocolitica]
MEINVLDRDFDVLLNACESRLRMRASEMEFSFVDYKKLAQDYLTEKIESFGEEWFHQHCFDELQSDAIYHLFDAEHRISLDRYLYISMCYFLLAIFLLEHGDYNDGRRALLESMDYCGRLRGTFIYRDFVDAKIEEERVRKENIKAGRNKKTLPVRSEIIKLLHAQAPVEKWGTVDDAINAILKDLYVFMEGKDFGLDVDNIYRTIMGWSENIADIKMVFSETVKKK